MGSFLETYDDSGFLGGYHSFLALFDYCRSLKSLVPLLGSLDLRSSTQYSPYTCEVTFRQVVRGMTSFLNGRKSHKKEKT